MTQITFRHADPGDPKLVTRLFALLFPDHDPEELLEENRLIIQSEEETILLACREDSPVGAAHLAIRHEYVEGCTAGEACGYLEAVYVLPAYRRKGIARQLVLQGESWLKEKGCRILASDCELDNLESECFHKKMGFEEVSRNIHFTRILDLP